MVQTGWDEQGPLERHRRPRVPHPGYGERGDSSVRSSASRRPRHPVGWLLLALGLSVAAAGVADGYARYGLLARPGALPAAR